MICFIALLQKLFSEPMAEFHIKLTHMWSSNGTFEEFEGQNENVAADLNDESD